MDNTKEKILEAATELFIQKGFAGTSISEIAKLAKINQSLIYHHLGSKQKLWQAVKNKLIDKYQYQLLSVHQDNLDYFIDQLIDQRLGLYEQEPKLLRLLQWQMLENTDEELLGSNSIAPQEWISSIKLLQDKNLITNAYPADVIVVYIHSAINGALLDLFHIFINDNNKKIIYIKMIKLGLTQFLDPRTTNLE